MEDKTRTVSETKPQFAIFDWIVSLPVIRILKPLYEWKRAFWIYCFLGFVSTVSNFVLYWLFTDKLGIVATVANAMAWILSTFLSFLMFRYLYFDRTDNSFISELIKFTSGRIFTFAVEELVIFIFVQKLGINDMVIKVILIAVTAALNYLISKLFVFKNKNN